MTWWRTYCSGVRSCAGTDDGQEERECLTRVRRRSKRCRRSFKTVANGCTEEEALAALVLDHLRVACSSTPAHHFPRTRTARPEPATAEAQTTKLRISSQSVVKLWMTSKPVISASPRTKSTTLSRETINDSRPASTTTPRFHNNSGGGIVPRRSHRRVVFYAGYAAHDRTLQRLSFSTSKAESCQLNSLQDGRADAQRRIDDGVVRNTRALTSNALVVSRKDTSKNN